MRVGRDYAYQRARKQVLAGAHSCALCGDPLDVDAPPRSRWAPSIDHVLPVSHTRGLDIATRQALATDPAGMRVVHYACNSQRGAGRARREHISREW
jgi:5-methylcytosine-specific restriction endonuclease McrA